MNAKLEPTPMPASLWAASAVAGREYPVLRGAQRTRVAIVGGGFTGLSAALHLAERGVEVTLLEAQSIGWGASGRNGGQVIPGLKHDPDTLIKRYGRERGQALIDTTGRNADVVFELIERLGIECDATRHGWIQPALDGASLRVTQGRARQWQEHGVPVTLLDRQEVSEQLGSSAYIGGWIDPRAGGLNPLSYCRGLAKAADHAGARLCEYSPVEQLQRQPDGWKLKLATGGEVIADQVLVCTNGYSGDLWPRLRQSVIAANSFQIATRPLSDAEGASVIPGNQVVSDARKLLLYYRRDSQGRLLMGGRGPFHDPQGPNDFTHLRRAIAQVYPALADVDIEYRWHGRVALTRDAMPHVHQPAPGLTIALGYNGRGVGMATHLGKLLGERLGSEDNDWQLPFSLSPIRPIPLHFLQKVYVGTVVNYYRLRDRLHI
ncbi:Glycine/D-amino acid oxidase [Modicisalibacter muralis]|uniref:Glycine/D-amino acid oxidase n=1 Tax=Modicisalibacter muralis TaxID=119000 RepID=A0A1G9H455_9GAMM|nr:FAD-binding oxidoreductase [Halomonas muralis]SDL07584.1 Glycine/D-amino acid oxidase [Halomonas muralis]